MPVPTKSQRSRSLMRRAALPERSYDGHTMRQDIKEHIAALDAQYPEIYEHLAAAMRDSDRQELWPPKPGKELLQKFHTFWGRGKKQAEQ